MLQLRLAIGLPNPIETLGVNYVVSKICQEYKDFFVGVFNCKVLHRYYYLEDTHKKCYRIYKKVFLVG